MWPNGQTINGSDSTPTSIASCVFNNQLYLFWPANDPSNLIYYSASANGTSWPPGKTINNTDRTVYALAACVFNNLLYLFWKPATGLGIYYSASADGISWPAGQLINQTDTTPGALAVCVAPGLGIPGYLCLFWRDSATNAILGSASVNGTSWPSGTAINSTDTTPDTPYAFVYQGMLLLFWKANDASNRIYYQYGGIATDGSGAPLFAPGILINQSDSTSQAPTACVSVNQMWLFLFWVANDPSNRLYFSAANPGPAIYAAGGVAAGPGLPGVVSNWPAGQVVDNFDSTPAPISAVLFNSMLFLFWKANDQSNRIWFTSALLDFQLTITDSSSGQPIDNAVCQYNSQPFAYGPTQLGPAQPSGSGVGPFNVFVMGIPANTTTGWTAPNGYSYQVVSNVGPNGTVLPSASITLQPPGVL